MSGKIITAMAAALVLASTGLAFAQSPSAEGAGSIFMQAPFAGILAPQSYSGLNGYYNRAPENASRPAYNSQVRAARPQNQGW